MIVACERGTSKRTVVRVAAIVGWLLGGACAGASTPLDRSSDSSVAAPADSGGASAGTTYVASMQGVDCLSTVPGCPAGWDDGSEINDDPTRAHPVVLPARSHSTYKRLRGCLMDGDEDWYLLPLRPLLLTDKSVEIDVRMNDAPWCCADLYPCSEDPHAVGLELYDAVTGALLASAVTRDGRVRAFFAPVPEDTDVHVRVYAPNPVSYGYILDVTVQDDFGQWEDECEC